MPAVTIGIVRPDSAVRGGNHVTALRWAGILRRLGLRAFVQGAWSGRECDLLIALHASKSRPSVERFRRERPGLPIVVGIAGTDLYGDGPVSTDALATLSAADRIVVLQELALERLPPELRARARVIHQSAAPPDPVEPLEGVLEVAVLANLRAVKDPLLAARAARSLPPASRVRVTLAGAPIEPALAAALERELAENPRLRWAGALPRPEALALLARARCLVSSSWHEGGANVISEALAAGLPVLATAVPGTVGLLGADHPGLFDAGDARGLARLLRSFEEEPGFAGELRARSRALAWIADPARERESWRRLLSELGLETAGTARGAARP